MPAPTMLQWTVTEKRYDFTGTEGTLRKTEKIEGKKGKIEKRGMQAYIFCCVIAGLGYFTDFFAIQPGGEKIRLARGGLLFMTV